MARTPEVWRNRIVGTGEEAPDQLLANPQNWRIHPAHQQEALKGVLNEVGWVQNIVVNKRTGHVVDGHLRIALAMREEAPTVPVVYVDLSEEEERLMLVALDPIAALAVADPDQLEDLLRAVQTNSEAVTSMLADLAKAAGLNTVDIFDDLAGGDDFAGTEVSWEVYVNAPSPGDRDEVQNLLKDNGYEPMTRTLRP